MWHPNPSQNRKWMPFVSGVIRLKANTLGDSPLYHTLYVGINQLSTAVFVLNGVPIYQIK